MQLLNAGKLREADRCTIENEPISSIDLMERASRAFAEKFIRLFPEKRNILVFCGTGNNGGDGLAISRMLFKHGYNVKTFVCENISEVKSSSSDFQLNLKRLNELDKSILFRLSETIPFPEIKESDIIIDALFGTGINRPVKGFFKKIIKSINNSPATVVSVDIPSGLLCDELTGGEGVIEADYTFTFELPKFSFLFPENEKRVGKFFILPIGLNKTFINACKTDYHFFTDEDANRIFKPRTKFSHKGNYGHACLVAGSYGKMGAVVLSGKACLRAGAGLLTIHSPKCGYSILQSVLPEAMTESSQSQNFISTLPLGKNYDAYGIGPGLGTQKITQKVLAQIFKKVNVPLALDADALNMIAKHKKLFKLIPSNSILTPHPGEFVRLFGKSADSFERLKLAVKKSNELKCIIVLKGCYTAICTKNGKVWFNSTGNPGMATAGSGDVLLGIITGLLAQGYLPEEAAKLGVYLHGLAGDISAQKNSEESLIAGDLIENLGNAFERIRNLT
ncbi:MAG: bifunctional ADP-dependent (S)-NAD(P)H-hydrate dehydratase/NAD(P)H-hydrate epimerase [Bacteroidetes bacterium RIFCSPLOWO2_02_FULL_36_8]|nr:MAG: bifunctional ADP-dependent (S)-NAD(P)H-hydrate dehydratase/NAD(P)H-hydrate epimerase [Bacteroidetes bacterium RIFCSPLOWO2_02_FULL_36_8]OFY72165.1 MAG: bifunctional ADP-dependent (S)-NAD(P)H-hydrate dehydratase/NAD(P)H-hydrate epimerase [Bacteroidetes bacterium RIFCSPLOWO2_12_FULL_37_12]